MKPILKTNLNIDSDVHKVLDFMVQTVLADKLVEVSSAIGKLGPIMWENVSQPLNNKFNTLWLTADLNSTIDSDIQLVANE